MIVLLFIFIAPVSGGRSCAVVCISYEHQFDCICWVMGCTAEHQAPEKTFWDYDFFCLNGTDVFFLQHLIDDDFGNE